MVRQRPVYRILQRRARRRESGDGGDRWWDGGVGDKRMTRRFDSREKTSRAGETKTGKREWKPPGLGESAKGKRERDAGDG